MVYFFWLTLWFTIKKFGSKHQYYHFLSKICHRVVLRGFFLSIMLDTGTLITPTTHTHTHTPRSFPKMPLFHAPPYRCFQISVFQPQYWSSIGSRIWFVRLQAIFDTKINFIKIDQVNILKNAFRIFWSLWELCPFGPQHVPVRSCGLRRPRADTRYAASPTCILQLPLSLTMSHIFSCTLYPTLRSSVWYPSFAHRNKFDIISYWYWHEGYCTCFKGISGET